MAEIIDIQNTEAPITESVLSGLQNKGGQNPMTVNDAAAINFNMTPQQQDMYDSFYQNKGTGALPFNSYYPGHNNPTGYAGTYSGSWNGGSINMPLFAPQGALVPLGMMDARDAAINHAALQKAKNVSDFQEYLNKNAPTSKLTNINENLTDRYFSYNKNAWDKAMKQNGNDAAKATYQLKNSHDFQAGLKSFHDYAKNGDFVIDTFAKIHDAEKTGNFIVPKELRNAMNALMSASDPSTDEFKNFSSKLGAFKLEEEFSKNLNTMAKDIFKQQDSDVKNMSDADFAKYYETATKYFTPQSKQFLKDQMYSIYGKDNEIYPKEKIDKAIDDFTAAVETKVTPHITQKHETKGKDIPIDWDTRESKPVNINVAEKNSLTGASSTRQSSVTQEDAITFHPETFKEQVVPKGVHIYNSEKGTVDVGTGTRKVQWTGMANMPIMNGVIIDDDMMKNGYIKAGGVREKIDPKLIHYKPMLVGSEEDIANGTDRETAGKRLGTFKTVYTPANEFSNELSGIKDKKKTPILNKYTEAAKQRTEELHKTAAPAPKKETTVTEVKRKTKDGKIAIFNADTKEFIRYE